MQRFDNYRIDNNPSVFKLTDTGLIVSANLTRAGNFTYLVDGKPFVEFRSPEEVFDEESLKTLQFAPLTIRHPKEMLDLKNIADHKVGNVGENIGRTANDEVRALLHFDNQDAIQTIVKNKEDGKPTELSAGYTAHVYKEPGTNSEGHFDGRQKKIRYNHVSVVDKGRAGKTVKVDNSLKGDNIVNISKKLDGIQIKDVITLDGLQFEVPQEAAEVVQMLMDRHDKLLVVVKDIHGEKEKLNAEKENLQVEKDQADKDLKESKDSLASFEDINSEKVQKLIKDNSELIKVCEELKIDTKDQAVKDLKVSVIKSFDEAFEVGEKSDEIIDIRYQGAVGFHNKSIKNDAAANQGAARFGLATSGKKDNSQNNAREYLDAMQNGGVAPKTQ